MKEMASPSDSPSAPPELPSPPFVEVEGILNFRDCGGYEVAPGKVIKRGVLFRSAEPANVTDAGVLKLQELGITHVYDLRSKLEFENAQAAEGWDKPKDLSPAQRLFTPVFLNEDYSPEALAQRFRDYSSGTEGFVRAYASILRSASSSSNLYAPYTAILKHLAEPAASPMLVHCRGGKDRTAVICALVLSLCGVEDDAVAYDYSLTNLGLWSRREGFVAGLLETDVFRNDRAGAEKMVSARKEVMIATLDYVREKYGSVEGYIVNECKVSPEAIEQIRKNLVVDLGADEKPLDWRTHAESML